MPNDSLEQRVETLENLVYSLLAPGMMTIQNNVQIFDGRTIQVGKKYGTMIGTESTQKLGFYGVTPVVQQAVSTIASGSSASDGTARAGVNAIITALIAVGIIKA